MPSVHKPIWHTVMRALVSAFVALHVSCFNSDDLFYAPCEPKQGDCGTADSEPPSSIQERGCFDPRGDRPGYCAPRCKSDTTCDMWATPVAVSGSSSRAECLPTEDYSICKLTCFSSQDCPSTMTCEAIHDVGLCIPRKSSE